MIRAELARESWEYKNYPEGEISEMVAIYESKGFSKEEAQRAMAIMTKKPEYTNCFLDHMMLQELDHQVPGPDESPLKDGTVTFVSFMIFGSIVRCPHCCDPPPPPSLLSFASANRPPPCFSTARSHCGRTSFSMARATPTKWDSSSFASPCACCAPLRLAPRKRCC